MTVAHILLAVAAAILVLGACVVALVRMRRRRKPVVTVIGPGAIQRTFAPTEKDRRIVSQIMKDAAAGNAHVAP